MKRILWLALILALAPLVHAQVIYPPGGGSTATASEWGNSSPFTGVIPVTANSTTLWSIVFPVNISANKIDFVVEAADNTGNLYDVGFYTSTGTLVCHVGATAGTTFAPSSAANVSLTFTSQPCKLTANTRYLFAITGNASTAALYNSTRMVMPISNVAASSGGTTSGGVLNSSITPPSDSYSNASAPPVMYFHN